jgi:hypothetical protein
MCFILLFACTPLKGVKLPAAAILLVITHCASCSDRVFVVGDEEDGLNLVLKKKISVAVLETF